MLNEQTFEKMEKSFVLMVALEKGKFEYYITEPKIFYEQYQEAEQVRDDLIQKKELKAEQIKIQTMWKVST